ncbi:MAG TPA: tRNA (adenosine(37)-N6)-dimethylallyltransferase MiaA [Vicinamibacteria bacterium]|nr:tRNA (adenosine(37)-N6)-dimethylallyltransferase MiaA [Vicinamibacteria bacterium]
MAAPLLIAVVGPTAAGKSAVGMRLAAEHQGEIVSCDSLQVYRGLDIGSAKPTREERARVAHHLIDVADPDEAFTAAEYGRRARKALADIRGRGRLPLVVGGSGLYLRALLSGLFEGPSRDQALRERLEKIADRFGDARLHRLLRGVDPEAAARIEPRDRRRVVRALEVFRATGRALSQHHRDGAEPLAGFDVRLVGLHPPRETLRRAVERRTDEMLAAGLLEETRALVARYAPGLRPLQAIGYRQAAAVVRGEMEVEDARRDMVKETMRYAKRQMTWFRHQAVVRWCATGDEAHARASGWIQQAR